MRARSAATTQASRRCGRGSQAASVRVVGERRALVGSPVSAQNSPSSSWQSGHVNSWADAVDVDRGHRRPAPLRVGDPLEALTHARRRRPELPVEVLAPVDAADDRVDRDRLVPEIALAEAQRRRQPRERRRASRKSS